MIGVFDSGLGGLSVLKEIKKQLPRYDYLYLGDSARTPYGNKSEEVIFKYTKQGVEFLFQQGCEIVILACNTASAKALRKIQQEYLPKKYPEKKVLGVLIPVVEELKEVINKDNKNKKIITGIIGTSATIRSQTYEREIDKLKINTKVTTKPTPLLVPLVEEGLFESKITHLVLRKYLRPLKDKKIDYLVLACTHYPFLEKEIKKQLPKKTKIISTPKAVARRLKEYLQKHKELEKRLTKKASIKFYSSDPSASFEKNVKKSFPEASVFEKINLK